MMQREESVDEIERYRDRIEELRAHVEEEGENIGKLGEDASEECTESLKAKLVWLPGGDCMWAVTASEDWTHDALGDLRVVAGTIYADGAPYLVKNPVLDGYFQSDESGEWLHVQAGCVAVDDETESIEWKSDLMDFPAVAKQYEACMEVPAYRHMAEQAAWSHMARGK